MDWLKNMRKKQNSIEPVKPSEPKFEPNQFFQSGFNQLLDCPNGSAMWWHSMPLPDGNRINGANQDKDLQFDMWQAMKIPCHQGLAGKRVLDIGANDGFFSLAACKAGALEVTSIDMDWGTWPLNINHACQIWDESPRIITADFRSHDFTERFDVILFLGVLYHLEDVFGCMKILSRLLAEHGVIYIETQMTQIESPLPVFEYASDIYPSTAPQDKKYLNLVGISNYLFPNEPAMVNLAHSYDFQFEALDGSHNNYTRKNPTRRFYKFSR